MTAALALDVLIEAARWTDADAAVVRRAVRAALDAAAADGALGSPSPIATAPVVELAVSLSDDAGIRDLNCQYRGRDRATNVLSFAALDAGPGEIPASVVAGMPLLLGDVVIARETCAREATAAGKGFDDHLTHLVVHGVLHLVGYDHIDEDEAEAMEALERRVLAGLGIGDPYRDGDGAVDE